MRTGAIALLAALVAFTRALPARGDDRRSTDAPAPPTLQPLIHRDAIASLELNIASVKPPTDSPATGRALAWFLHAGGELPFAGGNWYVGAADDLAGAAVPGVGDSVFLGSPEIWVRGIWSSAQGLSSGGGLGLVIPAPRESDERQQVILNTVRVARPWDEAYFAPLTVTFRPWFDVRHVTGRVILQLRQGLDISLPLGDQREFEKGFEFLAIGGFYVGIRAASWLGVGLELWESYAITADIPDASRAAFALSPGFRLMLPRFQPAFSVLFPVSTPLRGEAQSYVAMRFNMSFAFAGSSR